MPRSWNEITPLIPAWFIESGFVQLYLYYIKLSTKSYNIILTRYNLWSGYGKCKELRNYEKKNL